MNDNERIILLRDTGSGLLYGLCIVDKDADVEGAIMRAKEHEDWSTDDIYEELNCGFWDYEEFYI